MGSLLRYMGKPTLSSTVAGIWWKLTLTSDITTIWGKAQTILCCCYIKDRMNIKTGCKRNLIWEKNSEETKA
jgi:hypothetical protein